jgi:hypothetical protein
MTFDWPIGLDSDFAIWRALNVQYWPAQDTAGPKGSVRRQEEYDWSRRAIQRPVIKDGATGLDPGSAFVEPQGADLRAAWCDCRSQASHFGYERAEGFVSPDGLSSDTAHGYTAPAALRVNHWALTGEWTIRRQSILLHAAYGRIVCRFHACDVHLVMESGRRGSCTRFRVLLDGEIPGSAHGADADTYGYGVVDRARKYHLARQTMPVADRTLEIQFLDPDVEAYSVTFG